MAMMRNVQNVYSIMIR